LSRGSRAEVGSFRFETAKRDSGPTRGAFVEHAAALKKEIENPAIPPIEKTEIEIDLGIADCLLGISSNEKCHAHFAVLATRESFRPRCKFIFLASRILTSPKS
jgi:hypothetical protein